MSILGPSYIDHISQLHGFRYSYLAKDIVRKFLSPTLQGENLFTGSGDDDTLVSSPSLLLYNLLTTRVLPELKLFVDYYVTKIKTRCKMWALVAIFEKFLPS
jgi:hypothetical protein